ncbi:MAG: IS1595 family transposase [Lentisphaerae bacterium]|nr:MAG: IS1595 family transposase [Lentisphaerota bacterium]
MEQFSEYVAWFKGLTREEQEAVVERFLSLLTGEEGKKVVEDGAARGRKQRSLKCPHCGGVQINAAGKMRGKQMYVCRGCWKRFVEGHGTVMWRLKKPEQFKAYVYHMLRGESIRACAVAVGVSVPTAFAWRHRILSALAEREGEELKGTVEMDEIFFLHSDKGAKKLTRPPRKRGGRARRRGITDEHVTVVVAVSRDGKKVMKVAGRGRLSLNKLEAAIGDKLKSADVLCTDAHTTYQAFAKKHKLPHKVVRSQKHARVLEKIYHVQHVNQTTSHLRTWMRRFHGVSTKYLQNYLNWFLYLGKLKNQRNPLFAFVLTLITSHNAWWSWKRCMNI